MRFSLLAASVAAALIALPGLAAAQTTTVPAGKARIIDQHNTCRVVENTLSQDVMIPHKNADEWSRGQNSFLSKGRDGMNVRTCDERWVDFDSQTTLYQPMTSSCAVDVQGDVFCWTIDLTERNYTPPSLFLGNQPPHTPTPKRITGIPPMDTVATSGMGMACGAATGSGDIWCWGLNKNPYKRTGVTGIVEMDAAYSGFSTGRNAQGYATSESIHLFCGKKSDNTMWCWIPAGRPSQAGSDTYSRAPFQVPNPRTGAIGAFSVSDGEMVWTVGPNTYVSYLRKDLTAPMRTIRMHKDPGDLVTLSIANAGLFAGRDAIGTPDTAMTSPGCGIQSDGDLWCWGGLNSNRDGQNIWLDYPIQKSSWMERFYPTLINARTGTAEHIVHVGLSGFCVVYTDRRTFCDRPYHNAKTDPSYWRRNDPMDSKTEVLPQRFAKLQGTMYSDVMVAVGGFGDGTSDAERWHAYGSGFACGLDANGAIWCQGENNGAQLGDGTWTDRRNWTKVSF